MQFKVLTTVISAMLAITVFIGGISIYELLEKFDEECVNKFVKTDKESIPVSIAKGFARYTSGKDTKFIDVFNNADDAMYENKREIKGLK